MKTKIIELGGGLVKQSGDPQEDTDLANKKYVDSKFASWDGGKIISANPSSLEAILKIIPRMGCGASIVLVLEPGNYGVFKLALLDYEYITIWDKEPKFINNFNVANRDLSKIKLRNINGSNLDTCEYIGNKIVFTEDTVTSKLRDEVRIITDQIDNDTFILHEPLDTYPGEEDICSVQTQSVVFENFQISAGVLNKLSIEGIAAKTSNIALAYGKLDTYFCNFNARI